MVFRLMYCSLNCIRGTEAEIAQEIDKLLETSRQNNLRDGVTGVLLFNGAAWAQILEGSEGSVRALYRRILQEWRNDSVFLLEERWQQERMFAQWAMAYVDGDRLRSVDGTDLVLQDLCTDSATGAAKLTTWLANLMQVEVPKDSGSLSPPNSAP